MGYRPVARRGRCQSCAAETNIACDSCAHFICERCQDRHDREVEHRVYTG